MIRFTISYDGKHLKTYELDEHVITVGRLPENTISIANMGISRRHFRIEMNSDNDYLLNDLNSLNGVSVNNKLVKNAVLVSGDIISIGKYAMKFEIVNETEDIQEPQITDTDLNAPPDLDEDDGLETVLTDKLHDSDSSLETNSVPLPAISESETGDNSPVFIETNKHVVYKIDKDRITIGSSENDDIFVSGFLVGDGHVIIEKETNGIYIRSKKLMSKFKVNGKKTNDHMLEHKDRIEIGNSTFRYMENE